MYAAVSEIKHTQWQDSDTEHVLICLADWKAELQEALSSLAFDVTEMSVLENWNDTT